VYLSTKNKNVINFAKALKKTYTHTMYNTILNKLLFQNVIKTL